MQSMKNRASEVELEPVSSRSKTTLYAGALAVISVSNGVGVHVNRPPSWSRVARVDYIQGVTLVRISVSLRTSDALHCIVNIPTAEQISQSCDACRNKHRPTNVNCSANMGLHTFATNPHCLYDFATRANIGRWKTTEDNFLRSSKTGTVVFKRG